MRYLIGVDIGTSGTKTVLFDETGTVIASASCEYPLSQPENGWAEQRPEDWWQAVQDTLAQVMRRSGVNPDRVAGLGLSGQMHGLVMLDEEGEVIRPAILWCDGRTGEECREVTETIGAQRLIEISANPALTGFTAGKILWVRRHEPKHYAACRQLLLPKDYIRYKLTGIFATEVSDASGTNLLDVPRRNWSAEILDKLHIDPELLPPVYESVEVSGQISAEAASCTGLLEGTPVVGGAGDNAAAAVGTGVVSQGKAFTTIGSSGVIFAHMDEVTIDPGGRVHTFCHAVPGAWNVMSCSLAAGQSLKWFRDNFCQAEEETARGLGVDSYELINRQVAALPIGADKLLYLPYLMGERSPLLDEKARGVFFGLSGIHTKYHMLRAVMEGVGYSLRDSMEVFWEMGLQPREMMITGGGAKSPVWRQMLADLFRCGVATVGNEEGPALGAAILAGVGTGVYASVEEACEKVVRWNRELQAVEDNGRAYDAYYHLYRGLYPALRDSFHQLAAL